MRRWQPLVLGLAACAAMIAAIARADDPPFDVKPGLWRMTASGSASGAPPIPPEALARLSPEQRAQIEAAMQGALARAAKPRTVESCLTVEQLQHTPDFTHGIKWSCKQTVSKRTATEIESHAICSDPVQGEMTGSFHFTAVDRETIAGETHFERTQGGREMKMDQKISGKWAGADCGDVKPQKGH